MRGNDTHMCRCAEVSIGISPGRAMSGSPEDASGLRTPIVAVLGHVDHGKTTLLDRIRGSAVTEQEAGAITQHIGATAVPLDVIAELAGALVDPDDFDLPGLLFIDTPGHHAFTTLRSRGGALADLAILVVDVDDGFQPQTEEAVSILHRSETPFVLAANKVDTIPGWDPQEESPIQASYEEQTSVVQDRLDERLYQLIGSLNDAGFSSDLYWRVQDFQRNVGIVPVSAITGEGVPDLLAVMMGLAQRFLKEEMAVDVSGPGRGTVIEVKEAQGLGTTVDVLLTDGRLAVDDQLVVGGVEEPIVTTVRALLQPQPLEEIREGSGFHRVEAVTAAAGVKVAAPDLEEAMAGAPVLVVGDRDVDAVIDEVQAEMAEIEVTTEEAGIVLKADTLGSLEAIASTLEDELEVPLVRAEVGDISPTDVRIAATADEPRHRVIVGFNVEVLPEADEVLAEEPVRVFRDDVIYQLIEEYEDYLTALEEEQRETILEQIIRPGHVRILPDHVFRSSDPAVVGVEVLGGRIEVNTPLGKFSGDGPPERIGMIQGIQHEGEDLESATHGDRVSVAIDGPTIGRGVDEGDELWTDLPEKHAKILELELTDELPDHERETLTNYLERIREAEPFWGK